MKKEIIEKIDFKQFGPDPIVGVDEVGRGCLAGDVYAGAVCLKSELLCDLLTDSKLISEDRRRTLAKEIWENHWVGIGIASLDEINQFNILQASLIAMRRAVEALEKQMGKASSIVLIDGNQKIPKFERNQMTIVKGDLRCAPISAASIVAKVTRDEYMTKAGLKYPIYGFEKHKGYGSEYHRKQIEKYGPSPLHRVSFRGVKEHLPNR